MNQHQRKKKFLRLPEYPGGKEAFKKYIKENLKYPEEARQKKVEGIVQLSAAIDGNGDVLDVTVEKGLGSGCDKEAVRLIENVQFGSVKNRGVRVKTRKKFRIEFKLPKGRSLKYTVKKSSEKEEAQDQKSKGYSYSINLKSPFN